MGIKSHARTHGERSRKLIMKEEDDVVPFCLLPEGKSRWVSFSASTGLQLTSLLLLLWLPIMLPQSPTPVTHHSVIPLATQPLSEYKPLRKFHVPPARPQEQQPARFEALPLMAPKLQLRKLPNPQAPSLAPQFQAAGFTPRDPVPPRPEIRTGVLSNDSSVSATVSVPVRQVETGSFGDPSAVPAAKNPNKAAKIARIGSFDSPPGAGERSGGASGVRGAVTSVGFGNGLAQPANNSGAAAHAAVRQGLFSDARQPVETGQTRSSSETPSIQPVEILYKPNPAYTAEARALRLEGEVLLEVVFTASGEVQVLGVVRGLGHGLDESAMVAARQIRFKPERMNGRPVDSKATVHIVFQLAY